MAHPADGKPQELAQVLARAQAELGLSDEELAQRGEIDVEWLREFKAGYASRRSPTVRVTERLLNGVGLTLVAAKL